MRICPVCRATYQDLTLNFCLEDGSPLHDHSAVAAPTAPSGQVTFGTPEPNVVPYGVPSHPTPGTPVKKKSKTWLWVVGILVALTIGCGGTFGFVALVGVMMGDSEDASTADPKRAPKTDETPFEFSKWETAEDQYASLQVQGDGAVLKTKQTGYYYVLLTGKPLTSSLRTSALTVENRDSKKTSQGYGLVFHSEIPALTSGYAFLIDSVRQQFKVVQHTDSNERAIVEWRDSEAVRSGRQENVLQVEDTGNALKFFINGKKVYEMKDGLKGPVKNVGIYSSDAPIRFSALSTWR